MSALTAAEKVAGRAFRDAAQAALLASFGTEPPTHTVPNFLALYRHNCPARGGRSTALELKEVYQWSRAYLVFRTTPPIVVAEHDPDIPLEALDVEYTTVPAGRFGFIWRAGRCRACRQTARSRAGRLVDAHERPPLAGRVNR